MGANHRNIRNAVCNRLLIAGFVIIMTGCLMTDRDEEEPTKENELIFSTSSCSPFCLPPFNVDTNCVKMQMLLDGLKYKPIANYSCVVKNFFLGIDQIWVNGSIINAKKVVTIKFPIDVKPGKYDILHNTAYDAFYIPNIDASNFIAISGTLTIDVHDTGTKTVTGGFEFVGENLDSPVLPKIQFTEGCFTAKY